jgi:hypothetical protein
MMNNSVVQKVLLMCGILASLLYIFMNIFIPMQWAGYSSFSQTVSELSAIGSPTRMLWVPLCIMYGLFMITFGSGVWVSAGQERLLRVAGGLLMAYAAIGLVWPPMHLREVIAAGGGTLTDTLHIVWTAVTVPLMMLTMGFAATVFGKKFRYYTIVSIAVLIGFGVLTGLQGPSVGANLPTPWVGVWERICIGAFIIWIVAFAAILIKNLSQRQSQ